MWTGSEQDPEHGEITYFLFEGESGRSCIRLVESTGELEEVQDPKAALTMLCESHLQAAKTIVALSDILADKPKETQTDEPRPEQPAGSEPTGIQPPGGTESAPGNNPAPADGGIPTAGGGATLGNDAATNSGGDAPVAPEQAGTPADGQPGQVDQQVPG